MPLPSLPGRKAAMLPPYHTVCKVFVGKGAAFKGLKGLKIPDDFPDGPSNTLLMAEAGEPVPWTKPEDLEYLPDGPLPDLRCYFRDGFRACNAGGSTRWIPKDIDEQSLRALITRNAGDNTER